MNIYRTISVPCAIAGVSLIAACAFDNSPREAADARSAADKGNWPLSLALSEKAYADHPSVINEFNLATGYQQTGQKEKAVALYHDVVVKGTTTDMNSDRTDNGPGAPATNANLSDEAARRIEFIAGRPSGVTADRKIPETDSENFRENLNPRTF